MDWVRKWQGQSRLSWERKQYPDMWDRTQELPFCWNTPAASGNKEAPFSALALLSDLSEWSGRAEHCWTCVQRLEGIAEAKEKGQAGRQISLRGDVELSAQITQVLLHSLTHFCLQWITASFAGVSSQELMGTGNLQPGREAAMTGGAIRRKLGYTLPFAFFMAGIHWDILELRARWREWNICRELQLLQFSGWLNSLGQAGEGELRAVSPCWFASHPYWTRKGFSPGKQHLSVQRPATTA